MLLAALEHTAEGEPAIEAAGRIADVAIDIDLRVNVTEVADRALPDVVCSTCYGWFLFPETQRLPWRRSAIRLQAVLPFVRWSLPIRVMTTHFACPGFHVPPRTDRRPATPCS
jgi:hypothetical protein